MLAVGDRIPVDRGRDRIESPVGDGMLDTCLNISQKTYLWGQCGRCSVLWHWQSNQNMFKPKNKRGPAGVWKCVITDNNVIVVVETKIAKYYCSIRDWLSNTLSVHIDSVECNTLINTKLDCCIVILLQVKVFKKQFFGQRHYTYIKWSWRHVIR